MKSTNAYTVVELLVVIAILGIVAAIVLPVVSRSMENGRKLACVNNLRQLGTAIAVYSSDEDSKYPSEQVSLHRYGDFVITSGWAGRIFPYVKSTETFHCPDDPTSPSMTGHSSQTAYPVSYAINSNYKHADSDFQLTSPARTVLLFEDQGNIVQITATDEALDNAADASHEPDPEASASGDGIGLAYSNGGANPASVCFATGQLDNSVFNRTVRTAACYLAARHHGGANYIADDLHAVWITPALVSAGENPASATSLQSPSGCFLLPWHKDSIPCAEGTAVDIHKLTFSTR